MLAYIFSDFESATLISDLLSELAGCPKSPDSGPKNDTTQYGWTTSYVAIVKHPTLEKWYISSNAWTEKQRLDGKVTVSTPIALEDDWFPNPLE